jgi:hypothetical protein
MRGQPQGMPAVRVSGQGATAYRSVEAAPMMDHDHCDEDPQAHNKLYWFPVMRPANSSWHHCPNAYGFRFGDALSAPTEPTR